jgi:uncharacterized protein YjbI with pentapeptide repeats
MRAIDLLRQGTDAWNHRRAKGRIDLTHVEIRNASLRRVDFTDVDFDGSEFVSVDLQDARCDGARLNGVHMDRVRLEGADLRRAECKGTDLDHVCLSGAHFDDVEAFELKIRRSELVGTTFRRAVLRSSHIYNCDMANADCTGLVADWLALKRVSASSQLLAELRMKGCRIELENQPRREDLLDWDGVAIPDPDGPPACILHEGRAYWFAVNRWDFFISHATADKEAFARPLAEALKRAGQRVWLDVGEVKANDDLDGVIEYGTRAANFGVAILSPRFFGRQWTEREIDLLDRKDLFLVLHDGFTLEELANHRPSLRSRVTLDSALGAEGVAHALVDAISRPPGEI